MKNLRKKNHKENYGKYCCLLFPESLEKEIIENYSKTFDQEYLKGNFKVSKNILMTSGNLFEKLMEIKIDEPIRQYGLRMNLNYYLSLEARFSMN